MDRNVWFIAWRNVTRQLRRFVTVILAAVTGIVIISLIQGVVSGINQNIYAAAGRYYGGGILVMGMNNSPVSRDYAPARDEPTLERLAASHGHQVVGSNFRITVNTPSTVFFDGNSQQQKRINGIAWEKETKLLATLDLLEHSEKPLDDESIIVSKGTAARLKCGVGSSVLLQLLRNDGQLDTIRLSVWGIFQDAAVFGPYNAYVSKAALNKVLGNGPDDFSVFTMELAPGLDRVRFAAMFNQELSKVLPTLDLMHSREEYNRKNFSFTGTESHYSVMPVDFSIQQLNQLSEAVSLGLMVLLVFIALTVAVGTFNTYRIMLDERSRELGSMRAMGLSSNRLRDMILVEGLIIAIIASLAGLFVSILVINGLSSAPLGKIPGLDLFLNRGHLNPSVSPAQYGVDLSVMILLLELSAWMAARQVRNMSPLDAIVRR